jgi:hypothetical protein
LDRDCDIDSGKPLDVPISTFDNVKAGDEEDGGVGAIDVAVPA